jgi:hypothetical protein
VPLLQIVSLWFVLVAGDTACLNGHPTVQIEYRLRNSVFVGTVRSEHNESAEEKYFDQNGVRYTVRVDEVLRGRPPKTVLLFSENSSGRFPMQVGTKYLLFVYRDHGR